MTTRDPRSRVPPRPETVKESTRDPTASLSIELPSEDLIHPSHPSLAMGTSGDVGDERTKVESPSGRHKPQSNPPKPPPLPARSADDAEARIGTTLGAYKLAELLGKGGMGYVYRAEHVKLGREVALKLLRGDYAKRRDAVLRFFQEAKTVNRVRHRNIVDVTDFVELEDGTTFIIMELLSGQSLGKWARTGVDLPRALAVLVQICDGLGAAHAVGVVHRDLKPDNVIIVPTSDGAELVKLLDFGVAKLVNRDDEDVGFQTAAGSVIGTPAYMSPEQAGGMLVDHRSDIYSLGAIMYELFCGQPMFRGRSFGEYVRKHLTEIPVPPSQTKNGATIPTNLEALILRCLAKEPNDRFSHILELRDGLLHLLGSIETHPPTYASLAAQTALPPHPMMTTVPTPPVAQHSQIHPSMYSHYTQMPEPEPATPWWVWFVGGAIAVAIGVGGALWYAGRGESPPPQPAPVSQPSANPIDPAALPKPKLVELRFDSLPSGGVYADGRSAELCRTPCNFNVDLADGGPTDKRTFVVRSEGYQDMAVDVDFKSGQREYALTLQKLEATVPPTVDMTDAETPKTKKTTTTPTTTPTKKKNEKNEKKVEEKEKKPIVDDTKLEQIERDEKKPEEKKKPGPIDPSDTIDPFRKK